MVTNVTSLTGNGLKDWLIQRLTAVYFAVYFLFLVGFLLTHPHLNFHQWQSLFARPLFQVASIIGLLALIAHAWIGIWTVITDYIHCTALRLSVQLAFVLLLLGLLLWGLTIIWGH